MTMKKAVRHAALCAIALSLLNGCNNFFHELMPPDDNRIISFELPGQLGARIEENAVVVTLPPGAGTYTFIPKIEVSRKASLLPLTFDYVQAAFPQADIVKEAAAIYRTEDLTAYVTDLIKRNPDFNVPALDKGIDFSGPVNFLVVSGLGTIRQYTVYAAEDTGAPRLLGFGFSKYHNPELVADGFSLINEEAKTVSVYALYPEEMPSLSYALTPTFEMLGDGLLVDGAPVSSGGDPIQFNPALGVQTKTITVTRNGASINYTLNILFAEDPDSKRSITDFRFTKADNPSLALNAVAAIVNNDETGTITVQVLYNGAKPASLIPRFISPAMISPGTVSVAGAAQITGINAHDFSTPLEYVVVSRNGRYRRAYTVRVEYISMADAAPKMLSFGFSRAHNGSIAADSQAEIGEGSGLILAEVRYIGAAPPENLAPVFSANGLVSVSGSAQTSGMSGQNFTRQVKYTVQGALDPALKKDYWVQVRFVRDTSSDAVITAFSFHPDDNGGLADEIVGRIDQTAGTINLFAPVGSGVSSRVMIPRFSATGQVTVSGAVQTSGASGHIFGAPVTYTVTSANGAASKTYTVRVRELSSRIYVKADAVGDNDGASWHDAFTSLKDACEAAAQFPAEIPKEIWIAQGTYRPGEAGDRDAYFKLSPNTSYIGGFAGWESAKSQRDAAANTVTISGELGDGQYSLNLFANEFTGGMAVPLAGELFFENLTITSAKAVSIYYFNKGRDGAGIYARFNSTVPGGITINDCAFDNLHGSTYGAVYIAGLLGNADISNVTMRNITGTGIAVSSLSDFNLRISDADIQAASASYGGIYCSSGNSGSSVTVTDSIVTGMYCSVGYASSTSSAVITNIKSSARVLLWAGSITANRIEVINGMMEVSGNRITTHDVTVDNNYVSSVINGMNVEVLRGGTALITETTVKNGASSSSRVGLRVTGTSGSEVDINGLIIDTMKYTAASSNGIYGGGVYIASSGVVRISSTGTTRSCIQNVETNSSGGGLYFYGGGDLEIDGLTVKNCKTENPDNGWASGGGIYIANARSAVLNDVEIDNCHAEWGGGICTNAGTNSFRITNSTISNCTATANSGRNTGLGGGLYVQGSPNIEMSGVEFADTSANLGGGAYFSYTAPASGVTSAAITIQNSAAQNTLFDSCAAEWGGALCTNLPTTISIRGEISGTTFRDCTAVNYPLGLFPGANEQWKFKSGNIINGYPLTSQQALDLLVSNNIIRVSNGASVIYE
jgi:hypothetical protein